LWRTIIAMGAIRVTLKELLQSHGKTAYWLAEEMQQRNAKLTKGAIYNIVAGRANPSLDSIAQIIDVLSIALDEDIEQDKFWNMTPMRATPGPRREHPSNQSDK